MTAESNKISEYMIYLVRVLVICIALGGCRSDEISVQGPHYKKVGDVYGTIKVSGSSTMINLISLWCSGFSDIYHNTNCIVKSFGSGNAPIDLEKGNVDIGMMSEPMPAKDKEAFRNIYGYDPVDISVAIDMIVVLANKENPIDCISIDELDGVYSNSNSCQGSTDITTWGELNLSGSWASTQIKAYGRTPRSGTYNVFRNIALCGGTYKKSIQELASSRDVIDFVSRNTSSIGYSGAGRLTPGVKALKIGSSKNNCYPPEAEYAISKKYPFTRNLYLYLRENPREGMRKVTREFLKYITSREGQKAVIESGLVTLPESVMKEERKKISEKKPVSAEEIIN